MLIGYCMNRSDIEERVISKIANSFGLQPEELDLSMSFIKDLGADSLDNIEMVMMLENEFGFNIKEEEAEALLTIRSVVDYIVKRMYESK